jgi:DNA-binding MarR family transcriptional regulator
MLSYLESQILQKLVERYNASNVLCSFNELCSGIKTHRTKVREALKQLSKAGLIIDEKPKKHIGTDGKVHSGKKERISITPEGHGVYIAQLTHNLPQQLKSLRAEIKLIKSVIQRPEYQTKYKQNLENAKKQIEINRAEFLKACEEKGLTLEQGITNLISYAQDHLKTSDEIALSLRN